MNILSITEKKLTRTQKILLGVVVITFILTPLFIDIDLHSQEALALTSYDSGFEDSTSDYDSGFEDNSTGDVVETGNSYYGDYDANGDSEWSSSYDCDFEGSCTDDSTTDTSDTNITYNSCYDQCYSAGEYECTDNNSYHVCGDFDSDGCLEWGSIQYCNSDETCSNGQCVTTCSDQCSYSGQQDCSGNSGRTCGDHDSDSCLEWSSWESCASFCYYCGDGNCDSNCGETSYNCKQDCGPSCSDQCSYSSQKECSSDNSYHTCSDYDSDSCLEWSSNNYCNSDETCSNGECVTQCFSHDYQSCYNNDVYWYDSCDQREGKSQECGSSQWGSNYRCSANTLQRSWLNKSCDNSSCFSNTEWKDYENCGSDSWTNEYRCSNNTVQRKKHKQGCSGSSCYDYYNWENYEDCSNQGKTCSNGQCATTCSDQCSYSGQKECSSDNSYHTCSDYDSDSCLEWGSTQYCSSDETCSNGQCIKEQNQAPTARFSYSPSNPDTNDTISFSNQSYDNDGWISSHRWRFDDGSYSNQKNPYHSYSSSRNYTVKLTVTDNDGATDSTSKTISVGSTCSNQCSYSGQRRCGNSNNYQRCGDYDSDSCLEWSSSRSCEGSTSCGYGHCNNNQRPNWYCSGGDCEYNCNYSSSCNTQEHDYLRCYNDDVYWYDSNNDRERKYQDCGSDYCRNWSNDYCYSGNVYRKRTCYNKGCSGGSCYKNSYTDRDLVERCDSDESCHNGNCVDEQECSSGPCCKNGQYKSSNRICDTESKTQYGCPWGRSCGADLAKRTKTRKQYCSGSSAACTGSWSSWSDWSSWKLANGCSSSERCSVTNESCQYSSSCTGGNNYVSCHNQDLYWYNQSGTRLSKYRDCDDDNECTVDSCSGNSCENELICDGSTCEMGSEDYCESCEYCGDGICNCEETICSCSQDCKQGDLIVSISSKKSEETTEWQKDLSVNSNQNIDFLLTVTNTGADLINNLNLQANLTGLITYKNEFKSTGRFFAGDITQGINLSQLEPQTTRTFTFKGKTTNVSSEKQITVNAQASSDEFSDTDSIQIKIKKGTALSDNPLLAALKGITRAWYGWPLIILIIVLLWLAFSRLKRRWETA